MSRLLKYNQLIESQSLMISCPGIEASERTTNSFRWCTQPVQDSVNFLPNIKEDEARKRPPRQLKGDVEKCGRCAISFFNSLISARERFRQISLPMRSKLGYTHVANGEIHKDDGLSTPVFNNHFMVFEYEGVELAEQFSLADNL